jgi:Xaa-Pro dipeptidase
MVDAGSPISIIPNHVPVDRATWDAIKERLPNSTFEKNRARFFRLFKEKV